VLILTLSGYGALLAFLVLFLFPPRLRRVMPGGAVPLTRHRFLADAALGLALLHGLGWLAAEPASWRYLLPSAPLYMLAGLLAQLALLILALTSRQDARQKLSRTRFGFRGPHAILSALLLICALLHVFGAGLLLDGGWKALACALIASLAIAALLRPAARDR